MTPDATMESVIDSLAHLLIERHGEQASYTAAERARVLGDCNDRRTSRTWYLISRKIDEIAPPVPKSDYFSWPEAIDRLHSTSPDMNRDKKSDVESAEQGELVD